MCETCLQLESTLEFFDAFIVTGCVERSEANCVNSAIPASRMLRGLTNQLCREFVPHREFASIYGSSQTRRRMCVLIPLLYPQPLPVCSHRRQTIAVLFMLTTKRNAGPLKT